MSIICKKVLVCNRCRCETIVDDVKYIGAANVKLTAAPLNERYRVLSLDHNDIWDSFYLCDKCMDLVRSIIDGEDYILPKMAEKNERPPEDDKPDLNLYKKLPEDEDTVPTGSWHVKGPDPDEMEFEEIDFNESEEDDDLDSEEPKNEPIIRKWDPCKDKKRERIVWDDYIVKKIVDLIKKGCNKKQICTELKLTDKQYASFLYKVRNPEEVVGDNTKYVRWNKMYSDIFSDSNPRQKRRPFTKFNKIDSDTKGEIITAIKAGKTEDKISEEFNVSRSTIWLIKREFGLISRKLVKSEERFTPKLVREMFEARKDGMAWNAIAQVLNIPQSTLSLFVRSLREAKPGDWMYDLAKEYGYIDD